MGKFGLPLNIPDMEAGILFCYLEQLRNQCLRQSYRSLIEPYFNLTLAVFTLVEEDP